MDEEKNNAVKTNDQTAATGGVAEAPLLTEVDLEAKNAALEEEKNRLIEENANYKLGLLKEKRKNREEDSEESDEERMRRIARETLADSRITEIAREQDIIIQKALKENKELKLAQLNKTGVPVAMGPHSEAPAVKDTLVTPEQMAAFKARGWSDDKIDRYKRNLLKNTQ